MALLTRIQHEVKEVGLVILYFLLCFGFILTLKKLLLATYDIEFYVLSSTIIGALIVGKVVVVLDKTKAGTRFEKNYPLGVAALYKTMIYSLCTAFVLGAEKLFHAYRASPTLSEALMQVWMHKDRHIILAKVLCIGAAFLGYHLYAGLDRRLGNGRLKAMVFERP